MHHNPIVIDNLSYAYADGTQALSQISLEDCRWRTGSFSGANGLWQVYPAAASHGILLPQTGQVMVGEYPMQPSYLQAIRNFVGLVFQNPDDQLFMPTVWEDITFGPINQGLSGKELLHRCHHCLHAVGLDPERYAARSPENLSGGEKQRVAIAGVLAMQPQILVFDEPTAQLDPRSRRQLIDLLHHLPMTQLIATHDLDLALELCDRTIVLSQGHLVRQGPTSTILSDQPFLQQHHLELPLSYSRPYCQLDQAPEMVLSTR
jgi:cobalt/nickel transport system ATP-binding protein